jgi:predicted AAA+ superfamily ATPase
MDSQVLRVVLADNPWLEGQPLIPWLSRLLPERYIPRRLQLTADHRACLVVGPRQAGKSTLIWKTLADAGRPCLYLNCEEPSIQEWLRSPAIFLRDLDELGADIPSLFIEEAQCLNEAGLFIKGLVDRRTGRKIYATGSSSFDLQAKTRESLAGRVLRHLLLPLAIGEIAATMESPPAVQEFKLAEIAEQQLIHGGYPPVVTAEQPRREIANLVEAFIVRDVSDRFRIRNIAAFRKIMQLAASQIGNLCNYSEWATLAAVDSSTVSEYCRLLEETHVLRLLRPFVGGKRAEITSNPKVYYVDNGIRNQLFGGFGAGEQRGDRGCLLENLVLGELLKLLNPLLDGLWFWRSKSGAEVDFVIEHGGELAACEVKAGDSRGRITRSSQSFIDAYQPKLFLIANCSDYPPQNRGKTQVLFVRPWQVNPTLQEFLIR